MVKRKKILVFTILTCTLITWHSCSQTENGLAQKTYFKKLGGIILEAEQNIIETTNQKFLFSKKDWRNLTNLNTKNVVFKELKIADFGKQQEAINPHSIDYPHSIKIIEISPKSSKQQFHLTNYNDQANEELNIVCIHGLGGKENDFFPLIKNLSKKDFSGKINIISGKRFDSCFKSINEQANEVKTKLLEYFESKKNNPQHQLMIIGHSQGGIISLELLYLLQNYPNIKIKGLILIGTPLGGVDSIIKYLNEKRQKYPIIVSTIEKSIFGCTFGKNPKGVVGTTYKNQEEIIKNANSIIEKNKILTKVLIGKKPNNIEYPNSLLLVIQRIYRLFDSNILHLKRTPQSKTINEKKHSQFQTFKEICRGIANIKNLLKAENICGEVSNDLLLSEKTQTWKLQNNYVENIKLYNVIHNWKISLLASNKKENRIVAELESSKFFKEVNNMILNILNSSATFAKVV